MPNALISVWEKKGIVGLARRLADLGWGIYSSGGTHKVLVEGGVPSQDVAVMVGEPILGHRVVTLSREVHAGLLAQIWLDADLAELERIGVPAIDAFFGDFYPLEEEVRREGTTLQSVVEKTDIGGPTMARSAAKGHRLVAVMPKDREQVMQVILEESRSGEFRPEYKSLHRRALAAKAEGFVANYCLTSARYLSLGAIDGIIGTQMAACAYGENRWQSPAALFSIETDDPLALSKFTAVAGAQPSYNNWLDCDRLLAYITQVAAAWDINFGVVPKIAIAVKHGNTCGGAVSNDPRRTIEQMVAGDPRAVHGGLVMTNFPIDGELADALAHHLQPDGKLRLLDGIFAPDFTSEAIRTLERRKTDKCRFIVNPALAALSAASLDQTPRRRPVRGGFLGQPNYTFVLNVRDPRFKVHGDPARVLDRTTIEKILLARAIAGSSNSNTITLTTYGHGAVYQIGNGVGRQDRIGAAELAVKIAQDAGHSPVGAAAASDSFFFKPDAPQVLINAGVSIIFTTTGSVNDDENIKYFLSRGTTLCTMPDEVARGFSWH